MLAVEPGTGITVRDLLSGNERQVHEVNGSRTLARWDPDAIVIVDVFGKKTRQTAVSVIGNCQRRLKAYDRIR